MALISQKLRREIQEFLVSIEELNDVERRKQISRDADFPDKLLAQVEWGKQPISVFVSHLIDRTLAWGSFGRDDSRIALVQYLSAIQELVGGQHQLSLAQLLPRLSEELGGNEFQEPRNAEPPEVTFVNREREIVDITDELSLSPKYAIHAPAGYGKTWLLLRVQREFSKQGWLTLYAMAHRDNLVFDLSNSLLKSGSCDEVSGTSSMEVYRLADEFAAHVKTCWQSVARFPKGIVLLLDFEEMPTDFQVFEALVAEWLSRVIRSIYGLQFFSSDKNRLRIVITGRFFDGQVQRLLLYGEVPFRLRPLTPFVDQVIERSVEEYLPDLNPDWRRDIWSNLFYYTGGHPGCSSKILQLYWRKLKPEPAQFYNDHILEIRKIVHDAVNGILQDFPDAQKQLLLALSPFRYLSYGILEDIINHEPKILIWERGPDQLADFLTQTHLVSWDESGYLLRDDIVRRVFALHTREYDERADLFSVRCTQAREIYKRRLGRSEETAPPVRWAVEHIFQSLQIGIPKIATIQGRSELRRSFWGADDESAPEPGTDLFDCLSMLVDDRDPQVQIAALERALSAEREWELHYTLNFFFRDQAYETKWFGMLLVKVRAFVSRSPGS